MSLFSFFAASLRGGLSVPSPRYAVGFPLPSLAEYQQLIKDCSEGLVFQKTFDRTPKKQVKRSSSCHTGKRSRQYSKFVLKQHQLFARLWRVLRILSCLLRSAWHSSRQLLCLLSIASFSFSASYVPSIGKAQNTPAALVVLACAVGRAAGLSRLLRNGKSPANPCVVRLLLTLMLTRKPTYIGRSRFLRQLSLLAPVLHSQPPCVKNALRL